MTKLKLKKGDKVIVIAGKDKGSEGEILKVFPEDRKILVSGVNRVTKHKKPSQLGPGGIEKKEAKIDISNVALKDPKTSKPTRVGYKFIGEDNKKVRFAKASGEVLDN